MELLRSIIGVDGRQRLALQRAGATQGLVITVIVSRPMSPLDSSKQPQTKVPRARCSRPAWGQGKLLHSTTHRLPGRDAQALCGESIAKYALFRL